MSYKQQADIFKRTFDLKYAPIAISFTNHEASGDIYGKISICKAIKLASQGETS